MTHPFARFAPLLLASLCAATAAPAARAQETIRIGFIDPLSGPFANTGEAALKHFRAAFERDELRAKSGGRRFELVPLDNRASAQESVTQLRAAIDAGLRIVVQGQSSAAALALVDAIDKHNAREPGKSVLFLNYAALDPELTNAKCSFWHFRFDATVEMRMRALLAAAGAERRDRAVYLVNQDYSFGRSVAQTARDLMPALLPLARVVGEDLHPIGTVRDFSPYAAKIRAAGADAVITGNWGNDLALLVKAARESGYDGRFLTFFAGAPGGVTAIGRNGSGRLTQVGEWHPNMAGPAGKLMADAAQSFRRRFGEDFRYPRIFTLADLLAAAVGTAGGLRPEAIAYALEGARVATPMGPVEMRARDHQLLQPLVVSTLFPTARNGGPAEVEFDTEGSGMGFRTDLAVAAEATAPPTTCAMVRPPR